jgi:hypothetical protein
MLIQVLRKGSKSCTTTGNRRVTLITNSRDNSRKKNGGPNNDYATDNRTVYQVMMEIVKLSKRLLQSKHQKPLVQDLSCYQQFSIKAILIGITCFGLQHQLHKCCCKRHTIRLVFTGSPGPPQH